MPSTSAMQEGLRSPSPSSPTPGLRAGAGMAPNSSKRHTPEGPVPSALPRPASKRRRLVTLATNDEPGNPNGGHGTQPSSALLPPDTSAYDDEDELSIINEPFNSSMLSRPSLSAQLSARPTPQSGMGPPLGQKIFTVATNLVANPPQSAVVGSDAARAAAQVALVMEDYTVVQAKLGIAKARLSEQLVTLDAASAHPTPGSATKGSRIPEADEDDAIAGALGHIANLESRRTSLMERLHAAQLAELDASQQQDTRRLTVQVEHARLFRRVVDLGPTGLAALLRVLLNAAGVVSPDSADSSAAAERAAEIRQLLEDDIVREGLLLAFPTAANGADELAS